jgi:hypothetical protein
MSSPPKGLQAKGYATFESSDSDSDGQAGPSVHGTDYHENSTLSPHREPSYDRAQRRSFIEEDEDSLQIDIPTREEKKDTPVTWMSLPHKRQLAILVAARLSEPLVQSSLRVNYTYCSIG